MKNIFAITVFLFFVAAHPYCACAQQDQARSCVTKSVAGKVVEVDWVASVLVVKWLGANGYDELAISVPEDARITRGAEKVDFGDVELSDDVYIQYRDCGPAGLKAMTVNVNTNG